MKTPDSSWVASVLAEYEQPLIRYAVHITRDLDRAREVVQDTFLKLCRQKPDQIRDHIAQWLYTVCRNGALDVIRKEKKMTGIDEVQLNLQPDSAPEVSSNLEKAEQLAEIMKALNTLPTNQQEVIRLKFQGDLSYQEISQVTSLSVSNVGFLIHTGLKTIRQKMQAPQPALRRAQ
jgi:RNA polymerase sigma factor (sigma-70 family)